jgi:FlaA1/EpsC-like NDP-sugar epimerase
MFLLAYFVRVHWIFSTDFPFELFAILSAAATVVWIGFLAFVKAYRLPPRSGVRSWYDIILILVGGVIAVGFLIVSYFFPREILFSRLIGVYALLFGSLWLVFSQKIFRLLLGKAKKQGRGYKTIIIGANRVAEQFVTRVKTDPFAPFQIVGVIDPYGLAKSFAATPLLGKLDQLGSVCAREKVTALVQCDAFEHTLSLVSFCEEKDIKFQFLPSLRGVFEENLRLREIAGVKVISLVQRNYSGIKKTKFRFIDWLLRQLFDVD